MSVTKFIKCVTVGDGAVGKTCMLICYTSNKFPTGSRLWALLRLYGPHALSVGTYSAPSALVPFLFENEETCEGIGSPCAFSLVVAETDGVLLVFPDRITSPRCLTTSAPTSPWMATLSTWVSGTLLVLFLPISQLNFGTVSGSIPKNCSVWSLRSGQEDYSRLRPLSYRGADVFVLAFSLISRASYENVLKKGEELRKQIGAAAYIECSSKTQQNVKAVFDTAIKVVLQPPRRREAMPARKKSRRGSGCSVM
ncbi:hypothetical protein HU200_026761 [Digitaria exilis]|uniref:Uncharacterized protein n=1 Tax=Digitaria exilis TaxID=1010633 RepID=A0A835EV88_9POAL|nr:hypothetical protein HU200_026761 [Digitaria exilis]